MKWVWTILTTALILWFAQVFLFLFLFADLIVNVLLRLVVLFGQHLDNSALHTFISKLLAALLFPINQIMPISDQDSAPTMFSRLGLDSVVWGVVVGTVIHFVAGLGKKSASAKN